MAFCSINCANFPFQSLDLYRKQNFEILFGFKMDSLLSLLRSSFPFPFARHLLGFILVAGFWGKLLGLDERKCRWVVSVAWLFAFSLVSLTELCSF